MGMGVRGPQALAESGFCIKLFKNGYQQQAIMNVVDYRGKVWEIELQVEVPVSG